MRGWIGGCMKGVDWWVHEGVDWWVHEGGGLMGA